MPGRVKHLIEQGIEKKWCYACKAWKVLTDFYSCRRSGDKLASSCKGCEAEKRRLRSARNRMKDPMDGNTTKVCSICQRERLRYEFNFNKTTYDGYAAYCKDCSSAKWAYETYKVTQTRLFQMLLEQHGKCPICTKEIWEDYHIDHDHSCCSSRRSCGSCVRQLLCGTCNTAIGMLNDSPELMESAAAYIRKHRSAEPPL